jgi:hypothetical protein
MRGGYQGERRRAEVRRTAVTTGGSGYSRRAVLAAGAGGMALLDPPTGVEPDALDRDADPPREGPAAAAVAMLR